jgi:fatty-acyl-CoA synthase
VRIDDTGDPGDPYEAFLARGSADPVASKLGDEDEPISINYTSAPPVGPRARSTTTAAPISTRWVR